MSLVIVIMAMVILGSLGWTLAVLQSQSFQANVSEVDSQRALDMAESGSQWALYQLLSDTSWRQTSALLHTLYPGQYEIICRNPTVGETGDAIIESTGYYPTKANYTAMRKIKLLGKLGNFTHGNQVGVQVAGIFDWDNVSTSAIRINCDMVCGHYEGNDSNHTLDQAPDFQVPVTSRRRTVMIEGTMPMIDIEEYEAAASVRYNVAAETTVSGVSGNKTVYTNTDFFKAAMVGQVLRNVTSGTWDDTNWAVISSVDTANGAWAKLDRNVAGNSWKNDTVRVVKRICETDADRYRRIGGTNYYCYTNRGIIYIKSNGMAKGDVLIDLSNYNLYFDRTYIVAEGDIAIKGGNAINMLTNTRSGAASPPNLATKTGDIISDPPTSGSGRQKSRARSFNGLVYTQTGDAQFDYFYGNAIMANNLKFYHTITVNYSASRADPPYFVIEPVVLTWQEQ
ncbi:MAG: hypothetical protein PHH68_03095 [Candidatus Omnitrophica bacterium]|nr:hypothetical protein [Candidatus Omnitrophota bacterium]